MALPVTKIEDIHKKKFYELNEEEWKRRVDILEEVIKDKISFEVPQKEIQEIKLFYTGMEDDLKNTILNDLK